MSQIKTPSEILLIAKIGQPLSFVDIANQQFLKGGAINNRLPIMIAAERLCVQWDYDTNPTDETLIETSTYLYQLLGKYAGQAQNILNNLGGAVPVVTGPSNQSVNVGQNATYTISVSSSSDYTIAWFRDGVLIPNQTGLSYTLTNAQLSDTGAIFSALVTNLTGNTASSNATLTVASVITGYFTYSPTTDFYPILLTNSDPFTYGTSYSITHNASIVITLPGGMPANQYMLAKVPVGESVKTVWTNVVGINYGTIPDAQFEAIVQFGGFTYYASRGQITMNTSNTLILS